MSEALTIVCFTTTARQVLADRAIAMFCDHHGGAAARRIVVDDLVGTDGAFFVERTFAPREFGRLAMLHHGTALIAAVRPAVLRAVARVTAGVIVVLSDDAETFAPIPLLVEPADAVVLLNTRFGPPPLDGKLPDAVDTANRGRVDQDLLALRADDPRTMDFLDEWVRCLERSPHVGSNRLDPTTFPWLDSLADRPGVRCVTVASVPLSIRNADETQRQGKVSLIRWPGFDITRPWLLSAETGELPRIRPTTHPLLAKAANDRAQAIKSAMTEADLPDPAFDRLPTGHEVDDVVRLAYAKALAVFEAGNGAEPPNPFAGDPTDEFIRWLTTAAEGGQAPYTDAYRALHPEVADALPTDDDLTAWFADQGPATGVPRELRPSVPPLPPGQDNMSANPTVSNEPGIEVSGYLTAAFGMGAAARALVAACERSAVPTSVVIDRRTVHERNETSASPPDIAVDQDEPTQLAPVLVLARNADALLADPSDAIAARRAGRKVVGFWFWEVAVFPDRLRAAFALVDEIWVATEFVAEALRAHTDAPPIHLFPYPLPTPVDTDVASTSAHWFADAHGIEDDRFVVSFSFDYDSIADRKNPWGVVDTYRLAFPAPNELLNDGRRPLLVLKAIGALRHPIDHDRLRHSIGDRTDVLVIEDHLEAELQRGLFARTDAYLSLHRGEGLGLTMAEAMAVGTPVIATDYGGSRSFCHADNAILVPFSLIDIPPATSVYAGCGQWAEPNIEAAATALRSLADNPGEAAAMAARASDFLRALSITRQDEAAAFIETRVSSLFAERAASSSFNPTLQTPTPHLTHDHAPEGNVPTLDPVSSVLGVAHEQPAPSDAPVAMPAGLGPVILPGASAPARGAGGGVLGAVTDRVRATVEPMIATQAAFEQARVVALVDAVQQTRQAVLDLNVRAQAERETLTQVIAGVQSHVGNLQGNHDALYATVTELSTLSREALMGQIDLQSAIARIDERLDGLSRQIKAIADRLTSDQTVGSSSLSERAE